MFEQDKDFGKAPLFAAHSNPRAELSSSLKHYQQHTLERAYEGQDFFWGLTPTAEDFILLSFPQPLTVTGSVDTHTHSHSSLHQAREREHQAREQISVALCPLVKKEPLKIFFH